MHINSYKFNSRATRNQPICTSVFLLSSQFSPALLKKLSNGHANLQVQGPPPGAPQACETSWKGAQSENLLHFCKVTTEDMSSPGHCSHSWQCSIILWAFRREKEAQIWVVLQMCFWLLYAHINPQIIEEHEKMKQFIA